MRRRVANLLLPLALLAFAAKAELRMVSVRVTDLDDHPVQGLSLTLENSSPGVTNEFGVARLELDSSMPPGTQVSLYLSTQDGTEKTWFLISPWAGQGWYLPAPGEDHAPIKVDVKGRDSLLENDLFLRQVASVIADRSFRAESGLQLISVSSSNPEAVLRQVSEETGLSVSELAQALRRWSERNSDSLVEGAIDLAMSDFSTAEKKLELAAKENLAQAAKAYLYRGKAQYGQGKYLDSAASYEQAFQLEPDDLEIQTYLAYTNLKVRAYSRATQLLRRILAQHEQQLGRDAEQTLTAMGDLAFSLAAEKQYEEALLLEDEIFATRARTLGLGNEKTVGAMHSLALAYWRAGRCAESEVLQRHAIKAHLKNLKVRNDGVHLNTWNLLNDAYHLEHESFETLLSELLPLLSRQPSQLSKEEWIVRQNLLFFCGIRRALMTCGPPATKSTSSPRPNCPSRVRDPDPPRRREHDAP